MTKSSSDGRYIVSGAAAGAISAFVFVIIHNSFISDIWFSLIAMMVAGAICGLCIGWTYGLLFEAPSAGSWLRYNLLYTVMFMLLGAISVLVYEPVTTLSAVVEANEPPGDLIAQAIPLTVVFTLTSAIVLSLLYSRKWSHFFSILLTCAILVVLLGLNVSTIGLVSVPSSSFYLVAEFFGLIIALNLVYLTVFMFLERNSLFGKEPAA